ncbi:MAG: hypothetical protein WA021_02985, partial [Minisyncoccia bacterium]
NEYRFLQKKGLAGKNEAVRRALFKIYNDHRKGEQPSSEDLAFIKTGDVKNDDVSSTAQGRGRKTVASSPQSEPHVPEVSESVDEFQPDDEAATSETETPADLSSPALIGAERMGFIVRREERLLKMRESKEPLKVEVLTLSEKCTVDNAQSLEEATGFPDVQRLLDEKPIQPSAEEAKIVERSLVLCKFPKLPGLGIHFMDIRNFFNQNVDLKPAGLRELMAMDAGDQLNDVLSGSGDSFVAAIGDLDVQLDKERGLMPVRYYHEQGDWSGELSRTFVRPEIHRYPGEDVYVLAYKTDEN